MGSARDGSETDFARWANCPDAEVDLAAAACAIARDEYPDLDVPSEVARLDAMAHEVLDRDPPGAARERLAALDRAMFDRWRFSGNEADYYDPRNSYLNDVLERRRGIPITLSVVYLEIGWRLGLALEPVSFPGHFLVRATGGEAPEIVDVFEQGRRLERDALLDRLESVVGGSDAARAYLPRALATVSRREVVARMLRNLKGIHVSRSDWPRALRVIDHLVAIAPDATGEIRDRGHVYARLEAYRSAANDYERYLALEPAAGDAREIRDRIEAFRRAAGRLN